MKKISCLTLPFVLIFLLPMFAWAQEGEVLKVGEDYTVELEGRYWMPKLDSTVKIVWGGIGSDINLVQDLGFDERKDFYEGRLQVKFARKHKINIGYLPMKWEADKVLTKRVDFSGYRFFANERVKSGAELNFLRLGYEYDFLIGKYGFLGGVADGIITRAKVELKSATKSATEDETVIIPMVGVVGRVYPIKWVNLNGKVMTNFGVYGFFIDAEASVIYNPIKYVGISAGYRYFITNLRWEDNSIDIRLNGPFAALDIRF